MILEELVTVLGLEVKDDGLPAFQSSIGATIGKMGALVAGTVSAAAAISAFLNTTSETNAGAKFARSLDVSFEALQRLEFGAKRFGISAGSLQSVLAGLRSSGLSALAGTGDGFLEALGKLGLTPFDAVTGDLKDVLDLTMEIADAVAGAENQDLALGFAQAAGFATEFAPLLLQGSDGIRALAAEADSLGLIISEEQAESMERFQESIDVLGIKFNALVAEFGEGFAKIGTDGIESILDFARSDSFAELEDRFRALGLIISETVAADFDFLKDIIDLFPEGFLEDAIKAALVVRFPKSAIFAATAAAGADIQRARDGEEGTTSGGILDFFRGIGPSLLQGADLLQGIAAGEIDSLLDSRAVTAAGQLVENPFSLNPFSGPVTINNEINFPNNADPAGAAAEVEGVSADGFREALDTTRNRVLR